MSFSFRAAISALVLASTAGGVVAQPSNAASAAPRSAASGPAVTAAAPAAPGYRSAFDGYRPFTDQPVGSWREANDLVGRIGGWQAYAREGQGGAAANSSDKTPSAHDMATMPKRPASGAGDHSGHKTP